MRPWAWVQRVLALVVTVVFLLGAIASPADAKTKSRSFSSPKSSSSYSSGSSRSFSTPKPSAPKVTTPSSPSRSFSSPKPSTTTTPSSPPRTFTSPKPSGTTAPSQSYSTPSQSYSSSDRGYTSEPRSFSTQRPGSTTTPSTPKVSTIPSTPPVTYDTSRTKYSTRPPVIVYAPGNFEPWYWHDYYYGRPWYWRAWHRPVYYGDAGGFAINWWPIIIVGGIGLWVLLAVLSARTTRRRR